MTADDTTPQTADETYLGSIVYDALCDLQMVRRDPRESVEAAEYIAAKILNVLRGEPR